VNKGEVELFELEKKSAFLLLLPVLEAIGWPWQPSKARLLALFKQLHGARTMIMRAIKHGIQGV